MEGKMDSVVLWREVLGGNVNPSISFIANGGDSFQAVLVSVRAFELWHVDLDYLDVLEAPNATALTDLMKKLLRAPSRAN
jgi:hypothetical protein